MKTFNPPERILMGPGPSDVSKRVLNALSRPTIGHLDPEFIALMEEVKSLLRYAFRTKNDLTFPISAPGSAGMETCIVNLIEPGEKVIVCQNGVFGQRMNENILRAGGIPIVVKDNWGEPVDTSKVEKAFEENPDAVALCFVHAETSTGVRSDAEKLSRIAKLNDALVIVDAVTSLGGIPLEVDKWELDAVYSGTQKCLSTVPGISPATFGQKAIEKIKKRKNPCQSWFLDLSLVMNYWNESTKRSYHHTAPVNSMYALHESLMILKEEGIENTWNRHEKMHQALSSELNNIGLEFFVDQPHRLVQLNSIKIPKGVDDTFVRKTLLEDYNIEIGAGLGELAGKIWRIGLMGHSCHLKNIKTLAAALKELINQ